MVDLAFGEPTGQGWAQLAELGVAFVLSAVIGLERELKQRSAGVRTYTVVGIGSALFVLVSKYGFTDVLLSGRVVLDPSRVAAQIVSGLGFIGGGVIFVRRDAVRGLTTAASVWLTAAVGAAAAAGLEVLAAVGTAAYLVTVLGLPPVARMARRAVGAGHPQVRVTYLDGRGLLREVIRAITQAGFSVDHLGSADAREQTPHGPVAEVSVSLSGRGDFGSLLGELGSIDGVLSVDDGTAPEE